MNLDLIIPLAVLQARVHVLNQSGEEFTDLADMQAHRRLRGSAGEFVANLIAKGIVPSDPLTAVQRMIHAENDVLSKLQERVNGILHMGDHRILEPKDRSFSAEQLQEIRTQLSATEQN